MRNLPHRCAFIATAYLALCAIFASEALAQSGGELEIVVAGIKNPTRNDIVTRGTLFRIAPELHVGVNGGDSGLHTDYEWTGFDTLPESFSRSFAFFA